MLGFFEAFFAVLGAVLLVVAFCLVAFVFGQYGILPGTLAGLAWCAAAAAYVNVDFQ